MYRNTVIRPGYCPFCLWNEDLAGEDRLKSSNLKQLIEDEYILGEQEHGARLVCGYGQTFVDERSLRHHLHNTHKLNKAI
ncbi:hypothetical protein N7532_010369 [Penicillium argentinense]|uniref:Uncharacterized protein n=1 Tax=Penicillium argentinense TaxID=1131581 RepID=A0A9W9EPG0_9EURO|nr:uncharacterized protein N7532_010369 [Penicillium argentinense]KAJ5085598.1 hypothetical protein N7532_010369 [Penicillium argentinense]